MLWKRKRKNFKDGFTLIELLIAASILGIIGLVILTTFASGFHVFERVQAFGGPQADVLLALETMEKDLRNLFPVASLPFDGTADQIAFPAFVEGTQDVNGEETPVPSVGRIAYYIDDATYLDETGKILKRSTQTYGKASQESGIDEDGSEVLATVESITFEYFGYNEESETYAWQNSWGNEEENLLSGVKASIVYKDGERDVTVERTILIPTIQKIFEIEEEEAVEVGEDDED